MRRMFSENQLKEIVKDFLASNEDFEFGGDVNIGGVLKVAEYELDEDITISNLPENVNCYYAHARISNGKLNVALGFYISNTSSVAAKGSAEIGSIELSEEILAKIYPYLASIICTQAQYYCAVGGGGTSDMSISDGASIVRLTKASNGIKIIIAQQAITANPSWTRDCRFEFNLLLS